MESKVILSRMAISLFVMCIAQFSFQNSSRAEKSLEDLQTTALEILDKHCARCHQDGKTEGRYKEAAAGRFGHVLDIDKLIRKGDLKPGLPNASSVYNQINSGEMPKDKDESCDYSLEPEKGAYCGPTKEELAAVYEWIKKLGDKPKAPTRQFVSSTDIIGAMAADLTKTSEFIRPQIRYFSLTNLYNAGDSDKELELYKQGLAKLLNSLSFESDPIKLVAIDENQTVFRVNIKELGWDSHKWNAIAALNPYALEYDDPNFKTLQHATKSHQPFIRADWFTYTASQPPLYYDILGLPKTKQELEKLVGVNVAENIRNLKVARAGFRSSGVSQHNRLIERHKSRMGVYWESYDFAGNKDRQSFFKYPLGPIDVMGDISKKHGFVHDGGEIIFELPNGFHAYYLTDHKGRRLDKGPTQIVRDNDRLDSAVTNGVSCMGCHSKGIRYNPKREDAKMDQVRDYAKSTTELPLKLHEMIDAMYPTHDVFYKMMQSDAKRYRNALERAGIKVGAEGGVEPVNSLFIRFEQDLNALNASAEFGMSEERFEELANRNGGDIFALKQRLIHGAVPRDQFIDEFGKIIERITTHKLAKKITLKKKVDDYKDDYKKADDYKEVVKKDKKVQKHDDYNYSAKNKITPPPAERKKSKTFDLVFYPNQHEYFKGKLVSFVVQSSKPCYLTLLNIPEKGKTTVIFPNKFHQENKIDAGVSYQVPGKDIRGFKLRFGHTGKERVVAICNATRPDPLGITHDFKTRSFTTYNSDTEIVKKGFEKRIKTRQILVEGDEGKFESSKTEREKKMPPLVQNDYDKRVDIEARKSVLLHVQEY